MNLRTLLAVWGCWALMLLAAAAQSVTLIPTGATWKYLDNGTDQGTAWRALSFNDSAWAGGPAQLGYGDSDEATTVNGGPSGNRYITTYFRRAFTLPANTSFSSLTARLMRDDGGVVYLNGTEIFRSNMPGGTVGHLTQASATVNNAAESQFFSTTVPASALAFGSNVIAVEIHQIDSGSSDISFELDLTGLTAAATPPAIVTQPITRTVIAGSAATFRVTAAGPGPIGYQWRRNNLPLTNDGRVFGANSPSLTVAGLTVADAGSYSALATNAGGVATSAGATLNVLPAVPAMADNFDAGLDYSQWLSLGGTALTTNHGGSVSGPNSLWFGGAGPRLAMTRPINATNGAVVRFALRLGNGSGFNWDAVELPGDGVILEYSTNLGVNWTIFAAFNTTNYFSWQQVQLALPSAAEVPAVFLRWRQLANDGACCDHWALDDVSVLAAPSAPGIVFQSQNPTAYEGDAVTLYIAASGSLPSTFQWEFEGIPIPGADSALLFLTNVTPASAGSYQVSVVNAYGSAVSQPVNLTVLPIPTGIFDEFDPVIDFTQWSAFGTTVAATNYGGAASGPNSLWFGGDGERSATTRPIDTRVGGIISFQLRLAGNDGTANWEQADVPGEGVVFEYSTDDGVSWARIATYDSAEYTLGWTLQQMFIPPGARSPRTQFRWRQLSNSGNCCDHWAIDVVDIFSMEMPPIVLDGPDDRTASEGDSVTLTVSHGGTTPLAYQWYFNDAVIPGATRATLTLHGVTTNQAGLYRLMVRNDLGHDLSRDARLTVIDLSGDVFRIADLTTSNSMTVEHAALSGGPRGGFAASASRLFFSGSSALASFGLTNLDNPTNIPIFHESLVGDLRSGKIYVLATTAAPLTTGGGVATRLIEVDGRTGQLTANVTPLSAPIDLQNKYGDVGFFAGLGRIGVHNGTNACSIFLPSGLVVDHGRVGPLNHAGSGTWANWGVLEYFNGTTWMTYSENLARIARTRVTDGYTEMVAEPALFLSAFTCVPALGRWYFHFNRIGTGGVERVSGFAGAQFSTQSATQAVAIVSQPRGRTVVAGTSVEFTVVAQGFPLHYQWLRNGTPLPLENGFRLRLPGVAASDAAVYSVVVSNEFGSVTSVGAVLRVVPPGNVFVFDDANYVETFGGQYSESDTVQATLAALGHRVSTFTGIGSAPAPGRILLFPSLAYGNPAPTLDPLTRGALRDFVMNGGLVVIHGGGYSVRFADDVFGLSLGESFSFSAQYPRTAQSAGTAFAEAPASLPYNSAIYGIPTNTLPVGALSIYETNGSSLVAILPVGSGRIIYLGWNWENAAPLGALDGGWSEVLDAALQETAPPAAAPPAIAVEPRDRPTVPGVSITLSVVAYGSPALSFRWLREGVPLSGATNSSLVFASPAFSDVAGYSVVVANPFGVVTSRTAQVTVRPSRGLAGYYLDYFAAYTDVETPMLQAGFTPRRISNITTFDLAPLNLLLIEATYQGAASTELRDRLPAIAAWVLGGGRVIVHDITGYGNGLSVTNSTPLLIGAGHTLVTSAGVVNTDVSPPGGTLVTEGPHGTINDSSLDGATQLAYTTVLGSSLAPAMTPILQLSPTQFVAVSYGIGSGAVFYSTIYLSYLIDNEFPVSPVLRSVYLPNVIEHVMAHTPSGPVSIVQTPLDTSALAGGRVTLNVFASGLPPFTYQWRFNGSQIPGGTNATLTLSNVTAAAAGEYSVVIGNSYGSTNTAPGTLTVLDAKPFRIVSLGTGGAQVIDHDNLTGDDRGGIALSRNSVFVTGDNDTARYNAVNLAGGAVMPLQYDALISNLRTEQAYTLARAGTITTYGGGIVDSLIEIDDATGALTTNVIRLSTPVPMQNFQGGLYSGYDAAVLHDGTRAWRIDFTTGLVNDLGAMPLPLHQSSESWAHWGVAEYFGGSMWLVQVRDAQTITRSRVPDGFTTNVATFNNLSDMASITFSPSRDRWYFHYEGNGQFGGSSETLGYAAAVWDRPPQISTIADRVMNEDSTTNGIFFTVSDDQTAATGLVLSAFSSNTNLLSNSGIVLVGSAGSRTVSLTPAPNQHGTAVVTIVVMDGIGSTTNRSFNVAVLPVNDAPSFTAGTDIVVLEDAGPQSFPGWATQISPGPGEAGQALEFVVTNDTPALFSVQPALTSAGELSFTSAPDATGVATVTALLFDDGGTNNNGSDASGARTFTVTILPVNDAPVAGAQSVITPEDLPAGISLTGADLDGDALTYVVVMPPAHGSLGGSGASLVFTPAPDYHGPDSFTFKVNDGVADSAEATVLLTILPVNDAPVALSQTLSNIEDRVFSIALAGTDVDGDALNFEVLTPPAHGMLAPPVAPGAGWFYQPDTNYFGEDSFTFRAHDAATNSTPATVLIHNQAVNDAPTFDAGPDITVPEDSGPQTLPGWASNILPGPTNESTQSVRFTVILGLANFFAVTPAVSPDGTLTFTPAPNAHGTVEVTLQLADDGEGGQGSSAQARFHVTLMPVNDSPVADPAAHVLAEDSTLGPQMFLRAADADGDTLAFSIVTPPAHGTLAPAGLPAVIVDPIAGSAVTIARFLYVPAPDYHGSDGFTYSVHDGQAGSAPATVTLTVLPVNDTPVANAQSLAANAGVALPMTLTGTDVDGDALGFIVVTPPAHGSLGGSGANLIYTAAASYAGPDSFTFKANDGQADSPPVTVSIIVQSANHPPAVVPQTVRVRKNRAATVQLAGTDTDGDALTFGIVNPPAHGALSGAGSRVTYTPARNYRGTDSFTFKASDGAADSAPATVTLRVDTGNEEPVAIARVLNLVSIVPGSRDQFIIAPDNRHARVVLDGSQSFDSDGDTLQHAWFMEDGSTPFSARIVTTNLFSVGEHKVRLLVDDGDEDDRDSVEFEVITPAEALEEVEDLLDDCGLPRHRTRQLDDLLDDAMDYFDRGRFSSGAARLNVFQSRVHNQIAPVDAALAAKLTQAVQTVLDALGQ